MTDFVKLTPVFSDEFWEWARDKVTNQVNPSVHSPGTIVPVVTDEPPEWDLGMGIRPTDLLMFDVKVRGSFGLRRWSDAPGSSGSHRQIVGAYRALRPPEMMEQAEAFLQRAVEKVGCFHVTLSTSDDGLNGSLELYNGISKERGDIEQVLSICACLRLGAYPCQNGLGYRVENEGGNSEPVIPSFIGALCRALEVFYTWQLYDAQQSFEREENERGSKSSPDNQE